MKSKELIILFLILVLGFSCKSTKKATEISTTDETNCIEMDLLNQALEGLPADPFQIDSLVLENHCLNIYVNYGGGCGEAEFQLYYTQIVTQSMPPQTTLHLSFKDEDPCRLFVTKKLTYNLEPFVELANNGGVYLLIGEKRILFEIEE